MPSLRSNAKLGLLVGALVLTLNACCPDEPDHFVETDAPITQDLAVAEITNFFYQETGDIFELGSISWSSSWILDDSEWYAGWSAGCDVIWVVIFEGEKISQTALAHEIAHCWAGDVWPGCVYANNSHSDPKWWGEKGLVKRANALLRSRGL